MREIYLEGVVSKASRLLTLLDRNLFSKTFGCFDRNFWHYKIKDFPSGMSQEFALVLALLHETDFKGNIFYRNPMIQSYIEGALDFAARSSHEDGSTDDYFPEERALGAAVFSLHAMTEAYLLLHLEKSELVNFFTKRGEWVMAHMETGTLSNHHAIAASALYNLHLITKDERFKGAACKKIEQVLAWQSEEGWFQEYEGCDVGYLSVTIDFLAQYYVHTNDERVLKSLEKAVHFFSEVQHPDGTVGGEYASRSTYLFHPNGFEILSALNEKALRIANSYLKAKEAGLLAEDSDDYILGHSMISNLKAYRNACTAKRNYQLLNEKGTVPQRKHYSKSNLFLYGEGSRWAIFNLEKGGAGKIFKNKELVYSDAGVILRVDGKLAVSSMTDKQTAIQVGEKSISLGKSFMLYTQRYATPTIFLLFRLCLLVFGRLPGFRDLLRSYLQKKMILGKKKIAVLFAREIHFSKEGIRLITKIEDHAGVTEAAIASDLVPIYIAVSECFQKSLLKTPWRKIVPVNGALIREEVI